MEGLMGLIIFVTIILAVCYGLREADKNLMKNYIETGDKVRVVGTTEMCCGVLMQGNVSHVVEEVHIDRGVIMVLADNSLHWSNDLEKVGNGKQSNISN